MSMFLQFLFILLWHKVLVFQHGVIYSFGFILCYCNLYQNKIKAGISPELLGSLHESMVYSQLSKWNPLPCGGSSSALTSYCEPRGAVGYFDVCCKRIDCASRCRQLTPSRSVTCDKPHSELGSQMTQTPPLELHNCSYPRRPMCTQAFEVGVRAGLC